MQDELAEIVAGMIILAIIIGIVVYFALWVVLIGGVVYLIFRLCEEERYILAGVVSIIAFIVVVVILNAM